MEPVIRSTPSSSLRVIRESVCFGQLRVRAQISSQVIAWRRIVWVWTYSGLPGWITLPGFMRQWSRKLKAEAISIPDSIVSGEIVDVVLGPEQFLRQTLIVPKAAQANLSRAIDLNMRQSLPNGGAGLVWRYVVEKRDRSSLEIGVYIVRKATLEKIAAQIAEQGARLRSIDLVSPSLNEPFWDARRRVDKPRVFWNATAFVLLVMIWGFITWRESNDAAVLGYQISILEQERNALRARAVELSERLKAENTDVAALTRDVNALLTEAGRLHILLDLTEALSEDTWISELVITGDDLSLSGFTERDVTDIMAVLRDLPWVGRVDLGGPVIFDTWSRRNRFDLSVSMHPLTGQHL